MCFYAYMLLCYLSQNVSKLIFTIDVPKVSGVWANTPPKNQHVIGKKSDVLMYTI